MKHLLIFPPDWLPSDPYLSLPSLASVLRPAGHDLVQMDVNVEMYDLFFSRRFLEHVAPRIAHEKQHLQEVQGKRQLDEEEQELLDKLVTCTPELFQMTLNAPREFCAVRLFTILISWSGPPTAYIRRWL